MERRAGKEIRITHTTATMEQVKAANPKEEENGLIMQRKAKNDDAGRRGKEEVDRDKQKNRGSKRD